MRRMWWNSVHKDVQNKEQEDLDSKKLNNNENVI